MNFKFIFTILLIGHLMGDFYFQTQSMVERKNQELRVMFLHGLIYFAAIAPPFILFSMTLSVWGFIMLAPLLHIIIDYKKGWLCRKPFFEKRQGFIFVADQCTHILILALVAYYYTTNNSVAYSMIGSHLGKIYTILIPKLSIHKLVRLVCLFLFLGKPANIVVRQIIAIVDTNEKSDLDRDQKGRIIGILERYLAVILIIMGQYAAVGFAFTAKSVTRFDRISKDQDFAEQYLIGTMSSLLLATIGAVMYF